MRRIKQMKIKFFIKMFLMLFVAENALALSDDNRPDYQKEYDAYLHDLQIIEQKGYAPKNPILEGDLAKMSSEDRIRLTPSLSELRKRKINQSSSETDNGMDVLLQMAENEENAVQDAKSDTKIVRQVEIIRVPEEFREQYADVYEEETKHISTQKIVEQQEMERQKMLENEEALKIADHDNPFRLLNEQSLDPEKAVKQKKQKEDSLTDAYFQHSRAYVTDKTIVIKKKEPQNKEEIASDSESSKSVEDKKVPQIDTNKDKVNTKRVHNFSNGRSSSSTRGFSGGNKGIGAGMFLE